MAATKSSIVKRGLSMLMALVMVFSIGAFNVSAAGSDSLSEPGKYLVPVKSLTSKAPLPAVAAAFTKAFGDNITVSVDENGIKTATVTVYHMVVDLSSMGMAKFDANILSIDGSTTLASRPDVYSHPATDANGPNITLPPVQTNVTALEKVSFPLNTDADGKQKLTITVDFMNALMGGGNPYPTVVTLELDFDNVTADTSELSELIASYQALPQENYTSETWSAFALVLADAQELAADGGSVSEITAMIAGLQSAYDSLEYAGADYSKVDSALAKIPQNAALYTAESWAALQTAKNEVESGKDVQDQALVDGWAENIEAKITALEYVDADYTKLDEIIAKVPADLSGYTSESVNALQNAVKAVERGLKADQQTRVNQMASDIDTALKNLALKQTPGNDALDKDNLQDGIYEVSVKLWHASNDQASMAASSLYDTARIVVENGVKTMYIYTKPMTFGSITASLQEMQAADLNGNYTDAVVRSKDNAGNPTSFSFTLSHTQKYVNVKVNPHVAMMGNQALDARILVDYSTLKKVAQTPDDPAINLTAPAAGSAAPANNNTSSVKTGDESSYAGYILLALVSIGAVSAMVFYRKRKTA